METIGAAAVEWPPLAADALEEALAAPGGADSARARAATRKIAIKPPRAAQFRSAREWRVMVVFVGTGSTSGTLSTSYPEVNPLLPRALKLYNPRSQATRGANHVSEHPNSLQLRSFRDRRGG